MKKEILYSILTIGIFASLITAGTFAYFTDTETSIGNSFTAGTIDISVNGQDHWVETFSLDDMKPGYSQEITVEITNTGENPVKIWKIIKNVVTEENGIVEPEQDWYDTYNSGQPKNDLDSAIVYEMEIDGTIAVAEEAGITLDKIKDYHVNLVKLDNPFDQFNGDGIFYPGESITVRQKYYFMEDTENWAQSDQISFDIEFIAQQIDAPKPLKQMAFIDNTYNSPEYKASEDEITGILKYNPISLTFNYDFMGVGLDYNKEYCLIYYADPYPGNGLTQSTGALIDSGTPNSEGVLVLSGSKDLGTDLPNPDDQNYPHGAKIWLIPCSAYNEINHCVIGWPIDDTNWLLDNWPGLIKYKKGESPETPEIKTIYINDLGGDVSSQYGYSHDYSGADVSFTYITPSTGRLKGTIQATGLKPYCTYQLKLVGTPTCQDPIDGNDAINEHIGYKGRWTCTDCTCSGAGCNRDDTKYLANSHYRGDSSECIAGYLVFGYFTADSSGNANKYITGDTSYHVLWSGGGICNTNVNNNLAYLDSSHSTVLFSPADKVNGQPEAGRGGCNGLSLNPYSYSCKIVLTEESFHKGNWATVLEGNIDFEIN